MAELPIMPLRTAILLADTQYMSAEEFGAYCRILFTMWGCGGRLPADPRELARIAGVEPRRWKRVAARVLRPMTVAGDIVSQKRLTETWGAVQQLRLTRAKSGSIGGRRRWNPRIIS